jgi:penicillin amidase
MQARRPLRWVRRLVITLVLLLLLLVAALWMYLRASLPALDGTIHAEGLSSTVTVARDARGVPLLAAANRSDLAYATGFIHAQERFFQMDLLRRSAAGELAELFGPKALPLDREHRLHRFRARAERLIADLDPADRLFLDRYVAGVNDGLQALGARPFEYALVGARPRAWMPADSLLVAFAMYNDLQISTLKRELARGWLRDHSTPEQLAFLLPEATGVDTTLDHVPAPAPVPIPDRAPAWWGPGGSGKAVVALADAQAGYLSDLGSNNWAVAGNRTVQGAAIVSNDMHLGINLPNTWYRLAFQYPDAQGKPRRIVGLTLPGAPPLVLVGSNGHVAWGFTNSYGDYLDLVRAATDPAHPGQVLVGTEWETPARTEETIFVKGQAPERMLVRDTTLGPLLDADGATYAVHWTAHAPGALNLNGLRIEAATTVEEAMAVANTMGIPAQNIVLGDAHGNIGWTIAGLLPRRAEHGVDTTYPLAPGDAHGWSGWLEPAAYPRVLNPVDGQLATANARQLMGVDAQLIGDGGFDLGARHAQIERDLTALGPRADLAGVYQVMLDDRADYMAGWHTRALKALDAAALQGHPRRAELARVLEDGWTGRASIDSAGYKLTRDYMWSLGALLFGGANEQMSLREDKSAMSMATTRWSEVVARLLDARPAGWLPPGYADWHALELAALDRVIAEQAATGVPLAAATWGKRNTALIAHPITLAVPALKPWLAAPPDELPGDINLPRVAGPKFGQSERMTIMPGHEEQAVFNMPGGQGGHPLSPWFLRGHEDWVHGTPEPLLPGPAVHTLTLAP